MPLWGLALGLGLVHLSLGLTLHALVTSKVRRQLAGQPVDAPCMEWMRSVLLTQTHTPTCKVLLYLRLAALEFHVLTPRWWWRLLFVAHTHGTVAATLLVGLAARVMTLRGGLAEGEWLAAFLLALQLESLGEDKLLLLSGMAALSLLVALAVTSLHLLAGSNRQLNVGLIVLLDRLGVLRPLEVRGPNGIGLSTPQRHPNDSNGSQNTHTPTPTGARLQSPAPLWAAPRPAPRLLLRLRHRRPRLAGGLVHFLP